MKPDSPERAKALMLAHSPHIRHAIVSRARKQKLHHPTYGVADCPDCKVECKVWRNGRRTRRDCPTCSGLGLVVVVVTQ